MTDIKTIKALEFDKILALLSDFAVSAPAKEAIRELKPSYGFDEVTRLLRLTDEAFITKTKYNISPIVGFDDISDQLVKAQKGASLNMGELLSVARLIRSARILKKEISGVGEDIVLLKDLILPVYVDEELEKAIGDSIMGENEMRDEASDKLFSIRKKIKQADARLKERLRSYTRASNVSKYLQDNLVTVRNGRFVLPVKSECRSSVPGLIHDQSATGSTVFIEPFPVVDLNNEIISLKSEESAEIERILGVLSEMVSASAKQLEYCQEICTMSDIIYSKYAFMIKYNAIVPRLNNKGYLNLVDARHPLIPSDKVIPVSFSLGKDYKLLLITGPNTGGKTVSLKTAGLFCLMAYCGIPVPCAAESEVSVYDGIYCDIGDEQSILSSLSTFSSHIVNIKSITEKITRDSFVLLDEIGGGTDPAEGAALAIGIIKYLELMGARGILTTHYGELKEYAMLSKHIMNACMQFDEETLSPTYKLILGLPGVSNAIKIAENLGLGDYILKNAKNSLKNEKVQFEHVLSNAEKAKSDALKEKERYSDLCAEIEKEREQVFSERKKLKDKLDKINENARIEIKRIVSNNVERAEELIEEMKELVKRADSQAVFEARKKKRELEDLQYLTEQEIISSAKKPLSASDVKIGMKILFRNIGSSGEIRSLPDKKGMLDVLSGSAVIRTNINELSLMDTETTPPKVTKAKKVNSVSEVAPSIQEIKVIGLTVGEAVEIIYPYIMSGISQNITLKIVHGKGTGALGKGIQQFLRKRREIKSVRYGGYGEGETGVTFAEIY